MAPNWDDLKPVTAAPDWDSLKPTGGAPGGAQPSGLGDLWSKALANLPEGVRSQAASLMPSWGHNDKSYNPLRPADPANMPNDAINPVGTDAQMAAAIAATGLGSKLLAPKPAAPAPYGSMTPGAGPPTPPAGPYGTMQPGGPPAPPVIRGPGGRWQPNPAAQQQSGIPSNPITTAPPLPGTSPAQAQFLQKVIPGGAGLLGHAIGGPIGGLLGHAGARALMRGMS